MVAQPWPLIWGWFMDCKISVSISVSKKESVFKAFLSLSLGYLVMQAISHVCSTMHVCRTLAWMLAGFGIRIDLGSMFSQLQNYG
ncbi:hypothetical protein COCNU_scaffold033966G000010 [Cocos nucifera]|nr:hypothetical protein [Cocos nucifera]